MQVNWINTLNVFNVEIFHLANYNYSYIVMHSALLVTLNSPSLMHASYTQLASNGGIAATIF